MNIIEVRAEKVREAYEKYDNLLTEKERDIITKYYGIDLSVRHTLEEIGKQYFVTRERIRQIKVKALKKLNLTVLTEYRKTCQ